MLTWRVFSDDNVQGELVTAERMFINSGNGLIFSIRDPHAAPEAPLSPFEKAALTTKKPKRKPLVMITVRAFNTGGWHDLKLERPTP